MPKCFGIGVRLDLVSRHFAIVMAWQSQPTALFGHLDCSGQDALDLATDRSKFKLLPEQNADAVLRVNQLEDVTNGLVGEPVIIYEWTRKEIADPILEQEAIQMLIKMLEDISQLPPF